MPAANGLITWLTAHAVVVLAFSVALTLGLEQVWARLHRGPRAAGTGTSIAAGLAYAAAKGVVSKALMLAVALAVYEHRWLDLDPTSPTVWLVVFVGRDFAYYWTHRAEHRVRVLWASHMVHHSLERFTFTSAVRLPWMEALYKPVIALWVPLVGFHPAAYAAMGALVLLVGQLQHTELYRRRTPLDWVLVTPAVHRVHHGSNPEYLDRNFGSMLVVWDRLFGTYAPETVPVRYGLAGGKKISTPAQALAGGYPEVFAALRRQRGVVAAGRYLFAAP